MKNENLQSKTKKVSDIERGDSFGYWTIAGEPYRKANRAYYANAECVCGNKRDVKLHHLLKGNSKSCGCKKKEVALGTNSSLYDFDLTSNTNEYNSIVDKNSRLRNGTTAIRDTSNESHRRQLTKDINQGLSAFLENGGEIQQL